MITKNQIKYIHSLAIKKYRDKEKCFIAEGPKVIKDLFPLLTCKTLFYTADFRNKISSVLFKRIENTIEVTQKELERISLLRAPHEALALFHYSQDNFTQSDLLNISQKELCLALDSVQDPGNLGTILRIADWFGINHIFASKDTVDVYSPKVVQATMGAIGRVRIHYVDLPLFVHEASKKTPIWGTFLDGEDIYNKPLDNKGIIMMGNEGKGISPEISKMIAHRLLIPNYPVGSETSESLNVAVATALVCGEFRRRTF